MADDYLVEMYGERMAKRMEQAHSYGAHVRMCCETDTAMWHTRPCSVNGPQGLGTELTQSVGNSQCPDCGSSDPAIRVGLCTGAQTHNFHLVADDRMEHYSCHFVHAQRMPDHEGPCVPCSDPARCVENIPKVIDSGLIPHNKPLGVVGEFKYPIPRMESKGTEIVRELAGMDYSTDDPARVVVVKGMRLIPYRKCCATLVGIDAHDRHYLAHYFAEGQTVVKPDIDMNNIWGPSRLRIREDTVANDRTFENETRLR